MPAALLDPDTADQLRRACRTTVGDSLRSVTYFTRDDYEKPKRMTIEPKESAYKYYRLYSGRYAIVYDERIQIPEGHVGRVYPRSRVMRSGLHLTSALWDQGYEGRGGGLLLVPRTLDYVDIQVGASLAQMVFEKADGVESTYDGTHQGERLEADD